jgi:hypothetical protein
MKKNFLFAIALIVSTFSIAQTDLFTALNNFGADTEYKVYRMYKSGDGYELESWENKIKFEVINNKFGKPAGLRGAYSKTGKEVVSDNLRYKNVDHYSKPAFIREQNGFKETHIVVDSIVYMLWDMKEDGSSFTIKRIYLPKLNSAPKEEGKKLTMKEKMAAAKGALNDAKAEMKLLGEIKKMDHEKKIKDYIASMKAAQPALTAQEKKEIAEIEADYAKEDAEGEKKNAEFWASEQGQRILKERNKDSNNGGGKCTIINDLSSEQQSKYNDVRLAFTGYSIAATQIGKGQSLEVDCDDVKVYVGVHASTEKQRFLFNTEGMCGQTIRLSQYW